MSVNIEHYLIAGIKFDEKFTREYFENDELFEKLEYDFITEKHIACFLSDGMNGMYTYFGFIVKLNNENESVIELDYHKDMVIDSFKKIYPLIELKEENVKLYHLPHYV